MLQGVDFAGYESPRPIQVQTIPAVLAGRDVLGLAQTGTGKTAAFTLPILESLMARRRKSPSVLVLAPTRELANQIHSEITDLGQFTPIRSTTIYGGVSLKRQVDALRARPEIVVACPGRLLDLHRQRAIDLSHISTLVIDEADHMFDMGFLPDVRQIIGLVSEERQTLLFSATMPKEIRQLADQVLDDPEVVDLGNSKVVSTIDHELYPVSQRRKLDLLQFLFNADPFYSAIVFTRTKNRALRIARQLKNAGFDAVALQGNMSQNQRDKAMQGFREGRFQILVATDIAARGIDVANVSYVVNFDFPNTPDAYIHRIGRTGRSEQTGRAFTLVTPEDEAAVRTLERKLGRKVNRCVLPEYVDADEANSKSESGSANQSLAVERSSGGNGQRSAPRQQRSNGNSGERPAARKPKQHAGFQTGRSKRSRSRHRKHAERAV